MTHRDFQTSEPDKSHEYQEKATGSRVVSLEDCRPDDAGMRADRLRQAGAVIEEEMKAGAFPGAAYLVSRGGVLALAGACGQLSETRPQAANTATVYDMASCTKPMTAALTALILVERGKLSLLQGVPEFFPARTLPHLSQVTLRHLITHTSGLPAWVDLYTDTLCRAEAIDALLRVPLKAESGARYEYSCLGYILLGLICEQVSGVSLREFLQREVWNPLGMTSTDYGSANDASANVASTANCPARPFELIGQVHDGNAWRLDGISGNAGLFSNLADIRTFCEKVLLHPEDGYPLSRLGLQRYLSDQIRSDVGHHSYGWFCQGNGYLPGADLLPDDTVGHTGFTGTSILLAPSEELLIILLTNRVCSDPDGSKIRRTRRRFHNMVASALV